MRLERWFVPLFRHARPSTKDDWLLQPSSLNRFIAGERPMIKVRIEEPRRVTAKVGSDVSFVCTGLSKVCALSSVYLFQWICVKKRWLIERNVFISFHLALKTTHAKYEQCSLQKFCAVFQLSVVFALRPRKSYVCSLEVSFLMTRGVLPKRSGLCRVSNPRPLNSVRQCQNKEENAPSEKMPF